MNKYPVSLKFGVIAGIIMIIIMLAIYLVSVNSLASLVIYTIYLPLIFLMIWGGITARRELGKFNGFGHAFLTVFIISITATLLFDSFGFILYKVIDPQIPVIIKARVIENTSNMMEKLGASDEKTEETMQKIKDQDFTPTITSQLERMASSLIIGAIFSALIGLFVSRGENRPIIKAEE
jgi:Na+/H+-dicarboxylate symporter